jgi:hypothetical protein
VSVIGASFHCSQIARAGSSGFGAGGGAVVCGFGAGGGVVVCGFGAGGGAVVCGGVCGFGAGGGVVVCGFASICVASFASFSSSSAILASKSFLVVLALDI